MIPAIRLALAAAGLLVVYFEYFETGRPDPYLPLTYLTLAGYTAWSAILLVLAREPASTYWVDVVWYSALTALSGANTFFFVGFFFPILVASFRSGFRSGLLVAGAAAAALVAVSLGRTLSGAEPELDRLLLRPLYIVVLGFLAARWGASELTLKRRLALLSEMTALSNPRFGADRTLGTVLERLRRHYDADSCLLVSTAGPEAGTVRRARRDDPEAAIAAAVIPNELGELLGSGADEPLTLYKEGRWPHRTGRARSPQSERNASIAASLDAEAFLSVPVRHYDQALGRLFVADRRRRFRSSDIDFVLEVVARVVPLIENVRLVDRLAADAAAGERQRIARDIHDSVIQPYIGLQLAVAGLRDRLDGGVEVTGAELERILEMTRQTILDLRGRVTRLGGTGANGAMLPEAVRRFAARFGEVTGISTAVEVEGAFRLNDRLAAEAFQIVAEGLSNVRRHGRTTGATVRLDCVNERLRLRIENDTGEEPPAPFVPRSITGRAAALGGRTRVDPDAGGRTVVEVEIPL